MHCEKHAAPLASSRLTHLVIDGGSAATCTSRPSLIISVLSDLHFSVLMISSKSEHVAKTPGKPRSRHNRSQPLTAEPFALGNPVQLQTICVILSIAMFAEQSLSFIVVGATNQTSDAVVHVVVVLLLLVGGDARTTGVGYYSSVGFAIGSLVRRSAPLCRRRSSHGMRHDVRGMVDGAGCCLNLRSGEPAHNGSDFSLIYRDLNGKSTARVRAAFMQTSQQNRLLLFVLWCVCGGGWSRSQSHWLRSIGRGPQNQWLSVREIG